VQIRLKKDAKTVFAEKVVHLSMVVHMKDLINALMVTVEEIWEIVLENLIVQEMFHLDAQIIDVLIVSLNVQDLLNHSLLNLFN
jgi:hypothetical protein